MADFVGCCRLLDASKLVRANQQDQNDNDTGLARPRHRVSVGRWCDQNNFRVSDCHPGIHLAVMFGPKQYFAVFDPFRQNGDQSAFLDG